MVMTGTPRLPQCPATWPTPPSGQNRFGCAVLRPKLVNVTLIKSKSAGQAEAKTQPDK